MSCNLDTKKINTILDTMEKNHLRIEEIIKELAVEIYSTDKDEIKKRHNELLGFLDLIDDVCGIASYFMPNDDDHCQEHQAINDLQAVIDKVRVKL